MRKVKTPSNLHKEVLKIGADGGNMILDWDTDVATTRKQVLQKYRKQLLQISYKNSDGDIINEQYIGTSFTDIEQSKDNNWKEIPNQKQINYIQANALPPIKGNNFFNNRDATARVNGLVVENGNISSNSSWSTFICKVNPQKNYIVNGSNIRVAFFNDESFISYAYHLGK